MFKRKSGGIGCGVIVSVFSVFIIAIGIVFVYLAGLTVSDSIKAMQFQQTHPIVRATVLSVFTRTSTSYDSNTNTSSVRIDVCADFIKFFANGREIQVAVKDHQYCGISVGQQPAIAYDPQNPTNLQFVTSGDPFWGNILAIAMALSWGGFALSVCVSFLLGILGDVGWIRVSRPRSSLLRRGIKSIPVVFVVAMIICIATQIVMKIVNLNV